MSIPVPNRSAGQSASLISLASRTALLRLVKPTSPPPRQNDDDTIGTDDHPTRNPIRSNRSRQQPGSVRLRGGPTGERP